MASIVVENPMGGGTDESASGTITVNTSDTGRVLVLGIHAERDVHYGTLSSPTVTSVASTSGLTWNLLKQLQVNNSAATSTGYDDVELWWAYAAAQLTNEVITITFDSAVDNASFNYIAVGNALTPTNPWDSNASLPATASNSGTSVVPTQVTGVSSSASSGGLIVAVWGSTQSGITNPAFPTPGSGYTAPTPSTFGEPAGGVQEVGGHLNSYSTLEYKLVSSPQSNITVAFGQNTYDWGIIVGVIVGSPPPPKRAQRAISIH